jgi:hypothetical protein
VLAQTGAELSQGVLDLLARSFLHGRPVCPHAGGADDSSYGSLARAEHVLRYLSLLGGRERDSE